MNLFLTLAGFYIPDFIKKNKIRELFELTARSFQCAVPETKGLSYPELLSSYARFTQSIAETALQNNADLDAIKQRMYQHAFQLGEKLRRQFRIKTNSEMIRMSKILYRILKIQFEADPTGSVMIKRCFFSEFYSSDVCQLISSLDEGVAAGISGGGRLVFHERLTEGKECCSATLYFTENPG